MIFNYDPLNYLIETDENQNLIFTCVRGDRISPRVRYNLGDRGKLMPVSDVLATLKKHGVELTQKPITNLPLLFLWGRDGSQISYRSANVAPENLGEAIKRSEHAKLIKHFGLYQHDITYDDKPETETEFFIELVEGMGAGDIDGDEVLSDLLDCMKEVNQDFAKLLEGAGRNTPKVRVFEAGKSPMAVQMAMYMHRKKQYIFREKPGDEFTPDHTKLGGKVFSGPFGAKEVPATEEVVEITEKS